MYVCICNAVTDKQIRQAARSGVEDLWGLQRELGRLARARFEPVRYQPAAG